MSKNNKKIINFVLSINNDNGEKNFFMKNIKDNKKCFSFSLVDETFSNLDSFINFLLENINVYDLLIIEIENLENLDGLEKELCESFKNIWETEFSEIKKDLNDFELGELND